MIKTILSLLAPLYWRVARRYYSTMVINGCPHREVLHKYLRACGRVNDLGG